MAVFNPPNNNTIIVIIIREYRLRLVDVEGEESTDNKRAREICNKKKKDINIMYKNRVCVYSRNRYHTIKVKLRKFI